MFSSVLRDLSRRIRYIREILAEGLLESFCVLMVYVVMHLWTASWLLKLFEIEGKTIPLCSSTFLSLLKYNIVAVNTNLAHYTGSTLLIREPH